MKWFYITALGLVAALALSPLVLLDGQSDNANDGKVVTYNVYGAKVKSIDPATCGDTSSSAIQANFYEGLYCYHYLKRPLEVIPLLAESMPEVSEDGLTYTIRLKKDVKYFRNPCFGKDKDGSDATRTVTADDFVLAFKRVADFHLTTKLSLAFIHGRIVGLEEYRQATRRYRRGDFSRYQKENIEGIKALDEHTLQIRLTAPFPQFQYILAMHVYAPIPHEMISYYLERDRGGRLIPMRERDPELFDYKGAIGTGPYILTTWIKGGRIIMERNPDFRDDFYPTEGGPGDDEAGLLRDAGKKVPFIDVIDLIFVSENNPAWMMFENKLRDSAGIPRDVYSQVVSPDKKLLDKWQKQGIRLVKDTDPAVYWFAFNLNDPVLGSSKSLRQALCLCYDVEKHIELLFNGRGIRAVNTIPSSFKGHDEAGPSPYARLDLELAKKKIEDAKKELVEAGVIKPGDPIPQLTLDLGDRDESFRRMGTFAQKQFAQIGVNLKIELNDWPTLQQKVNTKQAQIYSMGWQADYPDAENFLQLYYSPNIKRGTNNTNYANPEFDRLYEKAATTVDENERVKLYVEMTKMLNEDCPALLLSEPVIFTLIYDWVYNTKLHPIGAGFTKYIRIDAKQRREMGGK